MLRRVLFVLVVLLTTNTAYAEMMTFEKEVEEIVSNSQSREQVEAFALQKAKRLAVEEAGTYISSLTLVTNAMLQREEITALASGVVQAKIVGTPGVKMVNSVVHIHVKARIQVDTAILDKQVAELLKEKGTIKKLEEEQKKVHELENRLANLKSTELKRLEELNNQAIALEQERERRRFANEEMALKAQGELKKAQIERLQKDREIQHQTDRMLAEQEQQRKAEAATILNEQDRIRRAQLENEQRWNDLARKSQIVQQQWMTIDDSLSLKQALEEAQSIKKEIANLKQRSEFQYEESVRTLKVAYEQQIAVSSPKMPPPLTARDPFESTAEYIDRKTTYQNLLNAANKDIAVKVDKLKREEVLKVASAKQEYLENQIKVIQPFVERLKTLQSRMFILPGEIVAVELGTPDADRNCFPTTITHKSDHWTVEWEYTDRNKARDIYSTRTFLKAEAIVQLDSSRPEGYVMTAARITHPGTGEQKTVVIAKPLELSEISAFDTDRKVTLEEVKKETTEAEFSAKYSSYFKDMTTEMEFVPIKGQTVYFIGKYEVTQGQWLKIMGSNPSHFSSCGNDCPVENVSWDDVQQFIQLLNRNNSNQFRLPTGAEWMYACFGGGGTNDKYCGGNHKDSLAWHFSNCRNMTHTVGTKQPNGYGIYDMSGNVEEWIQDGNDYHRGRRGGSCSTLPNYFEASYRDSRAKNERSSYRGFRLAVSPTK